MGLIKLVCIRSIYGQKEFTEEKETILVKICEGPLIRAHGLLDQWSRYALIDNIYRQEVHQNELETNGSVKTYFAVKLLRG